MSYPAQPYPRSNPVMPTTQQYPPYNSENHLAGNASTFYGREPEGNDSYPPTRSTSSRAGGGVLYSRSEKYNSTGHLFEKGGITRGSVAAQMAAEGQIPKKEGLRLFRTDEHAGGWLRGGKIRCCGRVTCCCLMLTIVIIISAVGSFFLYTRAPDITFNGIEPPLTGQQVDIQTGGFILNLGLNINVLNPNFFGATFQSITAAATYSAAPRIPFGGGALNDVTIPKNSNTTIHFPFTVNYTTSIDPGLVILRSISNDCGFRGSPAKDLVVAYTIVLNLKILSVSISPSFSSTASFPCPLTEGSLASLLGAGGGGGRLRQRSFDEEPLLLDERQIFERDRALEIVLKRGIETLTTTSRARSIRLFW